MARIEHFAIFAADLEALRAFYTEVFGLRVVVDNSKAVVPGYFLGDDAGTLLEIITRPEGIPAAETRYVCHVAFWVDEYDAARAELERRGVEFEIDTKVDTPTMRTEFFHDPEGNRCQIVWRSKPLGTSA
ncbi:MAG: VOC family protein [Isosphaeraceae bacterium]|nr:VOC family protein [Isosphaeraceae bacterium]